MRGTGAHGAGGPWPDFGIPKTGAGSTELGNGAWGKGRKWEGGLQTRGIKGKRNSVSELGGQRRERDSGNPEGNGDMKTGRGLGEARRRASQETITRKHPGIRGREAGSQGAKGVAEALASGGSWRRLPSMGQLAAPDVP